MTSASLADDPVPPKRLGGRRDRAAAARDRELRAASGVADLLARRPELRGVLRTADWIEESTLWSA
jgi:hypothetical protein